MHISSGLEIGFEAHPSGLETGVEGVEDLVGAVFVGDIAIDKCIDVELDRFELNDALVGTVA